jgi:hypothetical protein
MNISGGLTCARMCALVVATSVASKLSLLAVLILAACAKGVEISDDEVVVLPVVPEDGQIDAGPEAAAPLTENLSGMPLADVQGLSAADAGNGPDASSPDASSSSSR